MPDMDAMPDMGEETPGASNMPADGGDGGQQTVTLSPDMLPEGMMPKNGDKLTFCVTGDPDENGVPGYFEPPKSGGEEDDWDTAARKELSPRNPDDQPM